MQNTAGHGLDPKKWGPHAWQFLHMTASVMQTEAERKDFVNFINAFAKIIPCQMCRKHFAENRQKFDIQNYMKDEESLLMWTYLIHDAVNHAQHKTNDLRPSWPEVRSRYFKVNDSDANATPGSSEDYDSTICSEICSATVAKLQTQKESHNESKSKLKFSNRKVNLNKGARR